MAKRKYKSDKFQVRRINRSWWVLEKDLESNCYLKHEQVLYESVHTTTVEQARNCIKSHFGFFYFYN